MTRTNFLDDKGNTLELIRQVPSHTYAISVSNSDGDSCVFKPTPEQFRQLAEEFSRLVEFSDRVRK